MSLFAYERVTDLAAARPRAAAAGAHYIAGGTDLLQLVEEKVAAPELVLDLNGALDAGVAEGDGGVRIGALTRLSEVADHPLIQERYTAIAEALAATASPQVRHMATIAGNLLQRTRCLYFRDVVTPCNKREPGSGCSALHGQNRHNAILGGSEHCIAVQPSDFAVALAACDGEVIIAGEGGERRAPAADFHRIPGDTPQIETVLEPGEVITALWLPQAAGRRRSHYFKARDRASFEWAIASAAVSVAEADGRITEARVVAGGVATKPWRLTQVEAALAGQALDETAIAQAAALAAEGAQARQHNGYKIPLLRAVVARALSTIGTGESVG